MPVVRVHPERSRNLITNYDTTSTDIRDSVAALSPLVSKALSLLDQTGHPRKNGLDL